MNGSSLVLIIAMAALWPPWPFNRDSSDADLGPTIADLAAETVEIDTTTLIPGSQQKAIESYRMFLDLTSLDAGLQAEGMRRLADLQLESAEIEQLQQNLQTLGGDFADAVHLYTQLLESFLCCTSFRGRMRLMVTPPRRS
jgi:hypothetical protein